MKQIVCTVIGVLGGAAASIHQGMRGKVHR